LSSLFASNLIIANLNQHSRTFISSQKLSFSSALDVTTTGSPSQSSTVSALSTSKPNNDYSKTTKDCDGVAIICFKYPEECSDSGCGIIYKWKSRGDLVDFSLAASNFSASKGWLAIGFSNDSDMVKLN
jgi:hypothetical protein